MRKLLIAGAVLAVGVILLGYVATDWNPLSRVQASLRRVRQIEGAQMYLQAHQHQLDLCRKQIRAGAPYPAADREQDLLGLYYGSSYMFEGWVEEAQYHERNIEMHRQEIEQLTAEMGTLDQLALSLL